MKKQIHKQICKGHKVSINEDCYTCKTGDWNICCENYTPIPKEMVGLTQRERFRARYGEDYLQVLDARA